MTAPQVSFSRVRSAVMVVLLAVAAELAFASSHREAPGITEMPKCDATDFYMFRSYESGRAGFVTLIANYQPFQTSYGGPNFFAMDPDAIYQIHIDTNGDAREDLTFSFDFELELRDIPLNIGGQSVSVPLYNVSTIGPGAADIGALNVLETYEIEVIEGDQYRGRGRPVLDAATNSPVFRKPADNVGGKTFPDGSYETYARNHIFTVRLPNSELTARVFVGQRKDPFKVNLGETFDLVNLNPVGPVDAEEDSLADDNVTSIIIEVPIAYLVPGTDPVIGAWTTASLPQNRTLQRQPGFPGSGRERGPFIQVSRLAMPLVNELVIGLKDKNLFNASRPRNDAQFAAYVTNPTLPAILQSLFGVQAPCLPRNDLVQVFLTGVPELNRPVNVVAAEMMRLNTAIAPVARGQQSNLGVLGKDLAGFPNGRRPGDDVVDIELRAVMGALIADAKCAPGNTLELTDGATVSDQDFDGVFPYLRAPVSESGSKRRK